MGYALAVLVVAGLIFFVTANSGAVAHTFLRGEFISLAWADVAKAFWVNVRVAVGAEILVLVFGLVVAVMRMLPGPAGARCGALAMAYVDVFRAIPAHHRDLPGGVRPVPGPGPRASRTLPPIWLGHRRAHPDVQRVRVRGVPRRARSIHPSQGAAAGRWACATRRPCGPCSCRRRSGGSIPPLLNDFIGLQKDTALLGRHGRRRGVLRPELSGAALQPVAGHRGGGPVHHHHHPAGALRRLAIDVTPAASGRQLMSFLEIDEVHKSYGDNEVLKGVALERRAARGRLPDRRIRVGQVDAAAVRQRPGGDRLRRRSGSRATSSPGAGVDLNALRRDVGIVFQSYNLFPHMSVLDNVMLGARPGSAGLDRRAPRSAPWRCWTSVGMADKANGLPRQPLRRPAAAGRHRARAGDAAAGDAAGRDHRGARPRAGRRRAGDRPRARARRPHDAAGDPRDGLRQGGRHARCASCDAGAILERGTAQQIFEDPQEERTQQFLSRVLTARPA